MAQPEEVPSLDFTVDMMPLLGVRPATGRWFSDADVAPDTPDVVILAYGYWQSKFGGSPSVIGKDITVNGQQRQIVGVMPKEFQFLDNRPALILPMSFERSKVQLGNFSFNGVARLKPGVTMAQASADIERLIPISLRMFPPPPGFNVKLFESAHIEADLRPLKQDLVGDIGKTLWVLMGTIGLVLLIACANVANLLLVRAGAREHELAIRAALGAGGAEIARELLPESLMLGLLGGAVGIGLAYGGIRLRGAGAVAGLRGSTRFRIDRLVLLFALLISLARARCSAHCRRCKYFRERIWSRTLAGRRALAEPEP